MRLRQLPATRVRNGCSVQRAKCVHLFATASVIESVLHLMADKRSRLCRPSALLQCGDAAPCAHWPLVQLPLTAVASAPCESSGSGAQYGLHLDYIWDWRPKSSFKSSFHPGPRGQACNGRNGRPGKNLEKPSRTLDVARRRRCTPTAQSALTSFTEP